MPDTFVSIHAFAFVLAASRSLGCRCSIAYDIALRKPSLSSGI
jgi:hypothetical protein